MLPVLENEAVLTMSRGSIRFTYYGNHSVARRGDDVAPDYLLPKEFVVVSHAASAVG